MEPILVGRTQAAVMLGISVRTLSALVEAGELRRVRVGVRALFRRADLEKFARRDNHRTRPKGRKAV